MNILMFCLGMESVSFDGMMDMIKSTVDTDEEFKNLIGNSDGVGMFAVGIHIIHAWLIPSENDITEDGIEQARKMLSNRSYFFRLAQTDSSFKELVGTIES